jgi:hypothetical protein
MKIINPPPLEKGGDLEMYFLCNLQSKYSNDQNMRDVLDLEHLKLHRK